MIKNCKVVLNNRHATVIEFGNYEVQLPSIGRPADYIKVEFKDGRYAVLPDNYVESVINQDSVVVAETGESVEVAKVKKPKAKRKPKKTTTKASEDNKE